MRSRDRRFPPLRVPQAALSRPYYLTPIPSPPQPLATTGYRYFYNFLMSRVLFKWNHIVRNLWGLVFCTQPSCREMDPGPVCI